MSRDAPSGRPSRIRSAVVCALEPHAFSRLWGMTLVERLLRQLSSAGIERAVVVCPPGRASASFLRSDFARWTGISVEVLEAREGEEGALRRALDAAGGRAVLVDGHLVVDARVLDLLASSATARRFEPCEGRLAAVSASDLGPGASIPEGVAGATSADLDAYLRGTRKRVDPFAIAVEGPDGLRDAERATFSAVYKGATDFVTKFVFYLPTRWAVQALSPTRITPNQITAVSMVLSFGAVVPFFLGRYVEALCMGAAMAFLDTVDGKLARTTLRTSRTGDLLDHVSDTAYLVLWYVGLGWSLSGGRLLDPGDPVAWTHAALLAAFAADKILTGSFKRLHGYELHDYTRLDYVARIFIARRNPFLVGMAVALALDRPVLGLQIITVWYVATFAFHLARSLYLPWRGLEHQSIRI